MSTTPDLPGTTVPDHRGRTGLHLTGRGLDRNPRVEVADVELLAAGWHVLRATTFRYRGDDGEWTTQTRETYDRGNGATILLYDPDRRTVLLTRQFRYPVYVNDHPDGMPGPPDPRRHRSGGGRRRLLRCAPPRGRTGGGHPFPRAGGARPHPARGVRTARVG